MPLRLFRSRNFSLIAALGFLPGFAMFGAINFLPLYQQTVQGASATNCGLLLLPMMLAAMVVSMVAGQVITQTGKYKIFPIVGGVLIAVGLCAVRHHGRRTPPTLADRRLHGGARRRAWAS